MPFSFEQGYQSRVAKELGTFQNCLKVRELPDIFHYWADSKIRPKVETLGFSSPTGMFQKYLEQLCERETGRALHFVSIGSGNCDVEILLARHLLSKGHQHFAIDCLDLNPSMLERGLSAAEQDGVAAHIRGVQADFNHWEPEREYDAVVACQALHHVINLEGLFSQIRRALKPHGLFIISDIVGRNGHLRWPEALDIVHDFWRELPPAYRFNKILRRHEEMYINWDCSTEGFEGIRSQDILPLLLKTFHFRLFFAYGNVIDPFVDRAFGYNFNAAAEWDRNFIDRVHERDEQEMLAGRIKPVHMLAVVGNQPCEPLVFQPPFTPGFCVRWPDPSPEVDVVAANLAVLRNENVSLRLRAAEIENQLRLAADSRWLKLGRAFGFGPRLR